MNTRDQRGRSAPQAAKGYNRMRTMRAFHVPEPGCSLEPAQYDVPSPGPEHVRVRVEACGVCHSDVFALSGIPGSVYPLIPGHEICGIIDAVGTGVNGWGLGDRVGVGWFGGHCGGCESCRRGNFVTCVNLKAPGLQVNGGYAEYVVVPATALAHVPEGLSPVHAGPLMCAGVTAFNALRRAAGGSSRVIVVGIGGVGHLAIQFARHMGYETIAASHGQAKKARALELGAHHFIDVTDASCVDEVTALGGADILIATSPSSDDVTRLIPAVKAGGKIVVTGFSTEPIQVNSIDLIARNLTIMGSAAGTSMDAEETLRFSALNGIFPVVEEFSFDKAGDAYESMVTGTAMFRAVLNLHIEKAKERSRDVLTVPSLATSRPDSVLDCPPGQVPGIDELIEAAMRWHFSKETGSAFWLERARDLDFDPVRDVHSLADLRLFPNVVNELRNVRIQDLIPKGYGQEPPLLGVFESGGVTGQPKRVILMQDWLDRWLAWNQNQAESRNYPASPRHLLVAPTGPHLMTYLIMEGVRRQHGAVFSIDLDPRWVRKCINGGRTEETERYSEHLIAQLASVLQTQDIDMLTITPPLLEKLAQQPALVDRVREKVAIISWGGTHMDADTLQIYRTEIFPEITIQGGYGSTMALGGSLERIGHASDDLCVFDPFAPYVTYSVANSHTGTAVSYGERGQVIMNHVSKAMFVPNNLERDTAIRVSGLPGQPGDSVADVLPVQTFQGTEVTEGVY